MKRTFAAISLLLAGTSAYAAGSFDLHVTAGNLEGPLNVTADNDESAFGGGLRGFAEFMPDFWGFGSIQAAPGDTIRYKDARVGMNYIPAAKVAFGVGFDLVHLSLTQEFRDSERGRTGAGIAPNARILAKVSERFDLEARAGGIFLTKGNGYDAEIGVAYRIIGNVSAVLHAQYMEIKFSGEEAAFKVPHARVGVRFSY